MPVKEIQSVWCRRTGCEAEWLLGENYYWWLRQCELLTREEKHLNVSDIGYWQRSMERPGEQRKGWTEWKRWVNPEPNNMKRKEKWNEFESTTLKGECAWQQNEQLTWMNRRELLVELDSFTFCSYTSLDPWPLNGMYCIFLINTELIPDQQTGHMLLAPF